jgi:hypothetical protein
MDAAIAKSRTSFSSFIFLLELEEACTRLAD